MKTIIKNKSNKYVIPALFVVLGLLHNFQSNAQCNTSFTYTDNGGCYFHFNATGATTYSWDFGDGTTGQGSFVPNLYNSNGTYFVTLTGYDSLGNACDSTGQWVTLNCGGTSSCNTSFTYIDNGGCYFHFNATGATTYSWDFGNGSTAQGSFVAYSYYGSGSGSGSGTYFVTLTGYDSLGNVCDSTGQWLTVNCPSSCNASFTFADSSCYMYFFAAGATTYSWDFGDGTTGMGQYPIHNYITTGTYFVTLTAYDNLGNPCDSTGQWVTLNCGGTSSCNTSFTYIDNGGCYFHFNATGATTYSWDFGNGSTAQGSFVAYSYYGSGSGTYFVTLTGYDSLGNVCDSTGQWITVQCGVGVEEMDKKTTLNVYPNPLSYQAMIEFYLDENMKVELLIINILGEQLQMISSGNLTYGKHNFQLNSAEFTSGIYFLHMVTPYGSQTKKLIVEK